MSALKKCNYSLAAVFFIFLSACGGGGESGSTSVPNVPDDINSGLTGKLFLGVDGKVLDLSTGIYTTIPGIDWDGKVANNKYLTNASFSAISSLDGTGFLLTVDRCAECSDSSNSNYYLLHDDCLEKRNTSGAMSSGTRGRMVSNIKRGAKFSRDGEYIAFFYSDDRLVLPNDEMYIYDKNFQFYRSSVMPAAYGRSFDWTGDGRIVYSTDQKIYITTQYELVATELISFKNNEDRTYPYPTDLAVSPDGEKIAFVLVASSSAFADSHMGDLMVMNIDGTGLHKVIYSEKNSIPYVGNPTWSPDGDYIMFLEGYTNSSPTTVTPGTIYAVPSNSKDVELNYDGNSGVIAIKSYPKGTDRAVSYDAKLQGNWAWLR